MGHPMTRSLSLAPLLLCLLTVPATADKERTYHLPRARLVIEVSGVRFRRWALVNRLLRWW